MADQERERDKEQDKNKEQDKDKDSKVEGIIGRAKEAVGAATGADSLRDEGVSQQNKADAQDKVAQKEQELAEAKAEEKAHQAREDQNRPS